MLSWAPFLAAVLHIVEEFVWPGGFLEWYKAYRPEIAKSLTPRFIVIVNALLLFTTASAGFQGFSQNGVALWLTTASIELGNAGYHVLGTIRTKRYSPGVVTGVLLYVPISLYGYWFFVTNGLASHGTAAIALALGLLYPVWSLWNHRRRAARAA
jgi:Sec-independent protein secretion pathway component TatC